MNEFLFLVSVAGVTFVCMATWVMGKILFERWLNNDWCRHNWGAWENVEYEHRLCQHRHCTKCNMMERRVP